jgi:small subunit ribosomal protein S12
MPTPNQLLTNIRKKKKHKNRSPLLKGNPQKRGMCVRVYDTKPKKPNSAKRFVAKVLLTDRKLYYKQYAYSLYSWSGP